MAETVQSISQALLKQAKTQYLAPSFGTANSTEPKAEDNMSLLFSICDSLNNLYIKLEMLNHVLESI